MATIYQIKIKTVSAFCAHDEKYVKEMFEKFLQEYKDKETKLGFENTEIEVEQVNNLEQLQKANLQTTLFPMLTVFLIWLWKALCISFHKITFHRWDADLIKNVLDAPNNARGFYKGNPQYYYNGFWVILNGRCDRVLKYNKIISKVCQKKL